MTSKWTENDFDQMSWHDNAVHGIKIIEGEHGSGEFVLDLDYILDWLPSQNSIDCFQFRVAPAELRFHEATNLRVSLDYASATAALTPFSIHRIHVESVIYEGGVRSLKWRIEINWPHGEITFQAPRFTQVLTGNVVVTDNQSLSNEERSRLKRA